MQTCGTIRHLSLLKPHTQTYIRRGLRENRHYSCSAQAVEENMMSLFRVQKKRDLPRVREEKGQRDGEQKHTSTLVGNGQATVLLPKWLALSSDCSDSWYTF